MNTPAHLAAAGVVCQTVLYVDKKVGGRLPASLRVSACDIGCIVLGVGSHLLLDALPHYNWIVYLHWLSGLPYSWLIRDAIFGLMVFIPIVYWSRDRWGLVCLTAFAAMYPDFEKVAYHDFGLPKSLVLFRQHTLYLSGNDWGLPHPLLIVFEVSLIVACLIACRQLARRRA